MPTYEKLNGLVSLSSNTPGAPTGYGQQGEYLVERMLRHGMKVAALSNYGLEGSVTELKIGNKKIPHYPRGLAPYSDDVIPYHHAHHRQGKENLPHCVFTLYDVWVYQNPQLKKLPIVSWTPLDHITLPPKVRAFLEQDNVEPITMSPHGQRQLAEAGIASNYIPHGVDTKVFKPTPTVNGIPTKQFMGIRDDQFLVGMVAANKANGIIHRKAFAENLMAFSVLSKEYPDAVLYIHSEPTKIMNGFDLNNLIQATGIDKDKVIFPDPMQLRYGYPQETLAALYTAFDVLLAPSYGEGFGVPTIEAQACGTRVIGSNWAATKDLVAKDGWLVQGFPFWDEAQSAWFQIPAVSSIVEALRFAYQERGHSQTSLEFAKQFDADKVWKEKWIPFWQVYFAK